MAADPGAFLVLALQGVSLHFLQCETGSPGSAALITRRTCRSGVILPVQCWAVKSSDLTGHGEVDMLVCYSGFLDSSFAGTCRT